LLVAGSSGPTSCLPLFLHWDLPPCPFRGFIENRNKKGSRPFCIDGQRPTSHAVTGGGRSLVGIPSLNADGCGFCVVFHTSPLFSTPQLISAQTLTASSVLTMDHQPRNPIQDLLGQVTNLINTCSYLLENIVEQNTRLIAHIEQINNRMANIEVVLQSQEVILQAQDELIATYNNEVSELDTDVFVLDQDVHTLTLGVDQLLGLFWNQFPPPPSPPVGADEPTPTTPTLPPPVDPRRIQFPRLPTQRRALVPPPRTPRRSRTRSPSRGPSPDRGEA
jgi:hypothetical protein